MTFTSVFEEREFIGSKEIMAIVGCKETKASQIIREIRSVSALCPCVGRISKLDYECWVEKYGRKPRR